MSGFGNQVFGSSTFGVESASAIGFNTPYDIIAYALKAIGVVGVGQSPLAEDINDGMRALNGMLGQWQRKRWLIWHLADLPLTSTGAISYSVGVNGDFNVARPDRLEGAYFRQAINSVPNQVDWPLELLESREDYSRIALKNLGSLPRYIFYDAAYPLGYVYPWPIPQAGVYELHLLLKETLFQFPFLSQAIQLPPEYEEAIWTNLCIRLAPIFQRPVAPEIAGLAKTSLSVIRGANAQVPRLSIPMYLNRPALYDANSDRMY